MGGTCSTHVMRKAHRIVVGKPERLDVSIILK
jgi:hypothetical protein